MNHSIFKFGKLMLLLFLLLHGARVQAQSDRIYIDGVYTIAAGSNTQWYANVELGPNARLYIQDGEKAYFYGDSFKIAPTAKIYGANSAWTGFTEGSGTGSIVFKKSNPMNNGTSLQYLDAGNVTIPAIEINNITDVVLVNSGARIGTNLLFTSGHLWCGVNNLVLAPTAAIAGAGQTKYVVTNSTGFLAKEGLGSASFTFPVGYTADPLVGGTPTGYLPVTATNAGVADRYSVRAINPIFPTPVNPSKYLACSWQIVEGTPGGSNVTLSLQHNTATNQGSGYTEATATIVASPVATNWQPASLAAAATTTGSVAGSSLKTLAGITDFSTNTYFTKSGSFPDLIPAMDIDELGFASAGANRDFVINLFNVGTEATSGSTIVFRIAKVSSFTITYPTTSGTSNVLGGTANTNSNWIFTENANFITVTAMPGVSIAAGGSAAIGFHIQRNAGIPGNTVQNLTSVIIPGAGGEVKTDNNTTMLGITAN